MTFKPRILKPRVLNCLLVIAHFFVRFNLVISAFRSDQNKEQILWGKKSRFVDSELVIGFHELDFSFPPFLLPIRSVAF